MPWTADGHPVEMTVCLDVAVAVSAELSQNLAKIRDFFRILEFQTLLLEASLRLQLGIICTVSFFDFTMYVFG